MNKKCQNCKYWGSVKTEETLIHNWEEDKNNKEINVGKPSVTVRTCRGILPDKLYYRGDPEIVNDLAFMENAFTEEGTAYPADLITAAEFFCAHWEGKRND